VHPAADISRRGALVVAHNGQGGLVDVADIAPNALLALELCRAFSGRTDQPQKRRFAKSRVLTVNPRFPLELRNSWHTEWEGSCTT